MPTPAEIELAAKRALLQPGRNPLQQTLQEAILGQGQYTGGGLILSGKPVTANTTLADLPQTPMDAQWPGLNPRLPGNKPGKFQHTIDASTPGEVRSDYEFWTGQRPNNAETQRVDKLRATPQTLNPAQQAPVAARAVHKLPCHRPPAKRCQLPRYEPSGLPYPSYLLRTSPEPGSSTHTQLQQHPIQLPGPPPATHPPGTPASPDGPSSPEHPQPLPDWRRRWKPAPTRSPSGRHRRVQAVHRWHQAGQGRRLVSAPDQVLARNTLAQSHATTHTACKLIAQALQPYIPPGYRAKITVSIADGAILPENVSIETRPMQGSKRM